MSILEEKYCCLYSDENFNVFVTNFNQQPFSLILQVGF